VDGQCVLENAARAQAAALEHAAANWPIAAKPSSTAQPEQPAAPLQRADDNTNTIEAGRQAGGVGGDSGSAKKKKKKKKKARKAVPAEGVVMEARTFVPYDQRTAKLLGLS
jgi:hypothetical protein